MSITDRLKEFIKDEKNSALVFGGGWGEGKTYFWKDFALKHAHEGKMHRKNYAYVSLFGINSLTDLRNTLAVNIHSVDNMTKLTFMELVNSDVSYSGSALKRLIGRGLTSANGTAVSVPHASIGNVAPLYMAWTYHGVRNGLICLDDIERRSKGLELKDVMGLIADLVNERNCSVLAILNDGSLVGDDHNTWNESREKVFLGELRWHSSCETSLSHVYGASHHSEDDKFAIQAIKDLDIKNVRIIQRIKMAIDQVIPKLLIQTLPDTRNQVIRGLVMITYVRAGQGSGAPPMEMLRRSQLVEDVKDILAKKEGKPSQKTQQERDWGDLLRSYSYYINGRLDDLLDKSVHDGYPDLPPLQEAITALDEETKAYRTQEAMQKAWNLYHDHVGDNHSDVIREIFEAFQKGAETLSVSHADAAIHLVRDLEDEERALKMIHAWITPRIATRWKEFSPDNVVMFGQLSDIPFAEAISDAYMKALRNSMPQFDTLMDKIAQGGGYELSTIEGLAMASIDDYLGYFKQRGLAAVKSLLSLPLGGAPEYRELHTKAMTALSIISKGSVIDRRRVEQRVGDMDAFWQKYPPTRGGVPSPSSGATSGDALEPL